MTERLSESGLELSVASTKALGEKPCPYLKLFYSFTAPHIDELRAQRKIGDFERRLMR